MTRDYVPDLNSEQKKLARKALAEAIIGAFDKDHDGTISREEWEGFNWSNFSQYSLHGQNVAWYKRLAHTYSVDECSYANQIKLKKRINLMGDKCVTIHQNGFIRGFVMGWSDAGNKNQAIRYEIQEGSVLTNDYAEPKATIVLKGGGGDDGVEMKLCSTNLVVNSEKGDSLLIVGANQAGTPGVNFKLVLRLTDVGASLF